MYVTLTKIIPHNMEATLSSLLTAILIFRPNINTGHKWSLVFWAMGLKMHDNERIVLALHMLSVIFAMFMVKMIPTNNDILIVSKTLEQQKRIKDMEFDDEQRGIFQVIKDQEDDADQTETSPESLADSMDSLYTLSSPSDILIRTDSTENIELFDTKNDNNDKDKVEFVDSEIMASPRIPKM